MPLMHILDERQRLVAEVLDCLVTLTLMMQSGTSRTSTSGAESAFSCVCAPTDRLRHTAEAWLSIWRHLRQLLRLGCGLVRSGCFRRICRSGSFRSRLMLCLSFAPSVTVPFPSA